MSLNYLMALSRWKLIEIIMKNNMSETKMSPSRSKMFKYKDKSKMFECSEIKMFNTKIKGKMLKSSKVKC